MTDSTMPKPGGLRFGAVIVCDEVRREENGKEILLGVYSGHIVVPTFPAKLRVAVWAEIFPDRFGKMAVWFRYRAGDASLPPIDGELEVLDLSGPISVALPTMEIAFQHATTLEIEASENNQVWQSLKTKKVIEGKVPGFYSSHLPQA